MPKIEREREKNETVEQYTISINHRSISPWSSQNTHLSSRIRFSATILPLVVSIALKTTPYVPRRYFHQEQKQQQKPWIYKSSEECLQSHH